MKIHQGLVFISRRPAARAHTNMAVPKAQCPQNRRTLTLSMSLRRDSVVQITMPHVHPLQQTRQKYHEQ